MNKLATCVDHIEYFCIDLDSAGSGTSIINESAATGPVSLGTGDTAIIYFKVNNGTYKPRRRFTVKRQYIRRKSRFA